MMIQRILVALDGSERGEAVLPRVRAMATSDQCEVLLLHVAPSPPGCERIGHRLLFLDEQQTIIAVEKRSYLEEIGALLGAAAARARALVRFGDPAVEIVNTARRERADLIALVAAPRRRWGFFSRATLAERVVRSASVPVLLVGPGAAGL
jgi:nucleotide-binding universal stress UspA family protein